MATTYAFASTIPSASPRLLNVKSLYVCLSTLYALQFFNDGLSSFFSDCKQLLGDRTDRRKLRLLSHNKYQVKNKHLIRGWSFVSSFFKETEKRTVKNNKVKSVSFQNMVILLGVGIAHSGLFFSDMASAIPLFGVDEMVGGIHRIMLGDLDPSTTKIAINVLRPLFLIFNILFIVRIIMSWYPQLPVGKFPYVIAYAPTEPFLSPTRKVIPPVAGVDISPVVWFAIVSFLNEILLGQQGLLVLITQQKV